MTAVTVAARSKLPLWRTIGQSYAMWARNFPDLVRIAWVWMFTHGAGTCELELVGSAAHP
jgi:hypothetical protein